MLIRQTLLYLPAQVLAPLMQLATILVWAHLLPPEAVGIATLTVAIQEISFASFYMWWSQFVLRFLPRLRASDRSAAFLASEPVALGLGIGLQFLVLLPSLALYFGSVVDSGLLVVMLAFMISRSLNNYMAERARADVKILLYTTMQVGSPALGLATGFLFVELFGPTVISVLGGFVVAQTASMALAMVQSDIARHRPRLDPQIARQALTFGIPMMTASLLAVLALNAPRFIVDQTLGLAATGLFAVSYGLGLRVSSFASMMVTAGAYPLVVRKFETEGVAAAYAQLQRNTVLLASTVMPAAFGLIAINASVVAILLPPEFGPAAQAILPLAALCGLLRDLRSHTTNQVFLLHAKPQYASVISLVDLMLAVIFCFVGISVWGLIGAVIGPLVAAVIALASSVGFAIRFGYRVPLVDMLRIATAAALMALVVWTLPSTNNILLLAAEVACGAIVYAVLVALLMPDVRTALTAVISGFLRRAGLVGPSVSTEDRDA